MGVRRIQMFSGYYAQGNIRKEQEITYEKIRIRTICKDAAKILASSVATPFKRILAARLLKAWRV